VQPSQELASSQRLACSSSQPAQQCPGWPDSHFLPCCSGWGLLQVLLSLAVRQHLAPPFSLAGCWLPPAARSLQAPARFSEPAAPSKENLDIKAALTGSSLDTLLHRFSETCLCLYSASEEAALRKRHQGWSCVVDHFQLLQNVIVYLGYFLCSPLPRPSSNHASTHLSLCFGSSLPRATSTNSRQAPYARQ